MNSKEKYIDFIVDDLVKKTVGNVDPTKDSRIKVPFDLAIIAIVSDFGFPINSDFLTDFLGYVKVTYGAKEEEISDIWYRYRKIMRKVLD